MDELEQSQASPPLVSAVTATASPIPPTLLSLAGVPSRPHEIAHL